MVRVSRTWNVVVYTFWEEKLEILTVWRTFEAEGTEWEIAQSRLQNRLERLDCILQRSSDDPIDSLGKPVDQHASRGHPGYRSPSGLGVRLLTCIPALLFLSSTWCW
jgi:hypothetical protein